jgi:hypothetical protein
MFRIFQLLLLPLVVVIAAAFFSGVTYELGKRIDLRAAHLWMGFWAIPFCLAVTQMVCVTLTADPSDGMSGGTAFIGLIIGCFPLLGCLPGRHLLGYRTQPSSGLGFTAENRN